MALDATVIGKVAIKVVPQTDDLRSQTRREVEAATRGLEAEIGFTADVEDAAREIRRAVDDAQRQVRTAVNIRFDVQNEPETLAALRVVERELDKLNGERIDLNVDLNHDDLTAARDLLVEELDKAARIRVEIDNEAFRAATARIDTELRERFTNLNLNLFDESAERDKVRRLLAEIDDLRIAITPEISDRERARLESEIASREARISVHLNELEVRSTSTELAILARDRDVELFPTLNKAATARAVSAIAALAGTRNIGAFRQDIDRTLGQLDQLAPKVALTALAFANLGSAAATTGGNVLSVAAGVASIAPAAAALPGLFGGIAIGVGASIAVLRDFNTQLPEVGDQLTALQNQMSKRFYVRALEPLRSFIDTILPEFSAGLLKTSDSLGTYFAALANSGTQSLAGTLTPMFADLNESILISSGYTDSLTGIIQKLGAVGSAQLPGLARYFGDLLTRFDNFLAQKGVDGLSADIAEGTQALRDLGGVVLATGSLFAGLSRAATTGGGTTLNALRNTLDGAAKAVNSAGFQANLAKVFRAAYQGTSAIADRAGDDFRNLIKTISNLLDRVLPSAGRALGTLADGLFSALASPKLGESITGLFASIELAVSDIAPSLDELADGLSGVIDVVGALIEQVGDSLGPIIENLAPLIGDVARELVPLIDALGVVTNNVSDFATTIIGGLPAGLVASALAVGAVALAFAKLRAITPQVITAFRDVSFNANAAGFSLQRLRVSVSELVISMAAAPSAAAALGTGLRAIAGPAAKTGLALGALALLSTGAADSLGITNTVSLGLLGTLGGPWGAAAGVVVGAFLDIRAETKRSEKAMRAFDDALADPSATIQTLAAGLKGSITEFQDFSDVSKDAADSFGGYLRALGSGQGRSAIFDSLDGTNDKLSRQRDQIFDNATQVRVLADNFNLLGKAINAKSASYDALFGSANKGLDSFNDQALENLRKALDNPTENPNGILTQLSSLDDIYTQVKPVLDQMGLSLSDLSKNLNAEEAVQFGQDFLDAANYINSTKKKFDDVSSSVVALNDVTLATSVSADSLKKSLDALFSPTLDAEAALDKYDTTLKAFGKSIRENGANFTGFSDGAKANREAARSVVSDLETVLTTQADLGSSSIEVALAIKRMRQEFIDTATQSGVSKLAAEGLAASYKLTPGLVTTVFKQTGIKLSQQQINDLLGKLDSLPTKVQTYITQKGVPQTLGEINRLATRLDLTARERRILIKLSGLDKVKTDVEGTKTAVDKLGKSKVDVEVVARNGVTPSIKETKTKADALTRKPVTVTIQAHDFASSVIASVSRALENLDGKRAKVNISHVTTYRTVDDGKTTAGRPGEDTPSTPAAANRGIADVNNTAQRAIADTVTTVNRGVAEVTDLAQRSVVTTTQTVSRAAADTTQVVVDTVTRTNKSVADVGVQANRTVAKTTTVAAKAARTISDEFKSNFSTTLTAYATQAANVYDALLRKFKTKAGKAQIKGLFASDIAQFKELSAAHDRLMKQYDREAAKLKALKDEAQSYRDQVRDTVISSADVTQLGAVTYDGIVRGLDAARDKAVKFQKVIQGLIKAGLNKTTLAQILAAGPEAGLATAQAILDGGVSQINTIQSSINQAAQATSSAAGNAIYGNLVKDAQAAVDGLVKKLAPLQKALRDFAADLIDALRDQLKKEAIDLGINVEYKGPKSSGTKAAHAVTSAQPVGGALGQAHAGTVTSNRTLNYYAAPGKSFDSEEDLFDALGKAGDLFAA